MSNSVESGNAVYLDHAASTPIDSTVLAAMLPFFGAEFGNPSSLHASGRRANRAIARARQGVARVVSAEPDEIVFTGSGTESDNLAILGGARGAGDHVVISAIEHKAVIESARRLKREGFTVSIVPVDRDGLVSVERCLALVTPRTVLVSIMYANNEIGTVEPIKEIGAAIREKRAANSYPIFHTDACQAAGYLTLDVRSLGVDLMTLNGSKLYGPKGIGMLYRRRGVELNPVIVGGEQEGGLRSGTESVPLIVGFSEALGRADSMRESEAVRLSALRDYFIARILREVPGALLNGHRQRRLPNNVHISIPDVEGESLLLMLDDQGIAASTGSACSARDLKPSHVLAAIGQSEDLMHGSVRFSLGRSTDRQAIDRVMEVFPDIVARLSHMSALTAQV